MEGRILRFLQIIIKIFFGFYLEKIGEILEDMNREMIVKDLDVIYNRKGVMRDEFMDFGLSNWQDGYFFN